MCALWLNWLGLCQTSHLILDVLWRSVQLLRLKEPFAISQNTFFNSTSKIFPNCFSLLCCERPTLLGSARGRCPRRLRWHIATVSPCPELRHGCECRSSVLIPCLKLSLCKYRVGWWRCTINVYVGCELCTYTVALNPLGAIWLLYVLLYRKQKIAWIKTKDSE